MSSHAKLPGVNEEHLEPEEDEEEDVDFNPFLREALSPEASSSLSSENEGLGLDFGKVGSSSKGTNLSSNFTNELQNNVNKDMENDGEEVVMQPPGCTNENDSEDVCMHKAKKRISLSTSQTEIGSTDVEGCCGCTEFLPGKENNSSGGTDVEVVNEGEPPQSRYLGKSTTCLDDEEDAICRRTRARYSLANFTLEELETFLQESGDDDEFQNADDEQEYRKFLAAVLQGGDDEGQTLQENATAEDTDEDNDADFELEIEEALDSDLDESMRGKRQKEKYGVEGRRPETRQNKRQKTSVQNKKKISEQANRPLRPLLPSVPKAQLAPFPTLDWQKLTPDNSYNSPYPTQGSSINGFTPNQIGQLHCLIHEHVQLLVQVFSLCVLDHSRQHIAGEIQKMISEVVYKRDEVASRRKMPYPGYCFHPRCIQPSVSEELPELQHVHGIAESSSATPNPVRDCSSVSDVPIPHYSDPSGGENNNDVHSTHVDSLHITKGSSWMPLVNGPVFSILDVAPLNLVERYIADASRAAEQYRQRFTELDFGHHFEKEPLFPLPNLSAFTEASSEVVRGAPSAGTGSVSSALPGNRQPKKTLAATLVESTKKQSVALVPKEIVKLAQRFYPLFNSALFPHKPPPATVVNRVLFTDAEDELLAMGLMECNTDWKAIQQRFLPCKSKHQIFVRQKNRCSSKAPENSIKAVRKMKTSPLTEEEMARIHEGLRILKLDWMSVWKYIVPYRDPSLLPRQWRIANGTQKSYKTDPAKKEKRRKYESERRKSKGAALANWQSPSEKEDYQVCNADEENKSGNDNMEDENEAYVHEAFLSDWRPVNSGLPSSELALSLNSLQPGGILPQAGACMAENLRYGESPPITGYVHESIAASEFSQHPSHVTRVRYSASYTLTSNQFGPDWVSKSSKSQVKLRPYRRRRSKDSQLVKLAPDLPPVNLPPSVRVISQSAFRSYHCGSSNSTKATSGGVGGEIVAPVASGTTVDVGKRRNTFSCHDTANACPQGSRLHTNQCTSGGKDSESDLQMHPLLFQASEDGPSTYDRMDCSTSATFNFLPANQLQANSSLLSKAQELDTPIDHFYTSLRSNEIPSSTCTIDFHPLLQKVDNVNNCPPIISPDYQVPPELGSFGRKYIQLRNPSDPVMAEQVSDGPRSVELASTYEKANELDLEIHLSSTSRKGKVMRSGALTEHSSNHSETELVGGSTSRDSQRFYNPSFHIGNCSPEATFAAGNNIHVLGAQATVLASDQSNPGIVMEQEELSDSEEEVGEHVEFECEEMTDSEGDNSDCGQHPDTQYKEVAEITTEGHITIGEIKSRQVEPTTCNSVEGTLRATTNSNTSSSTRRLAGKGKDTTRSRTNKLQVSNDASPIGKSSSSRPSRLCKKTAPSTNAITEKSKSSRKPRSRVYRKDAASNSDYVNSGCFPRNDDSSKVEDDPNKATEAKKECTELGLKS